MAHNFKRKSAGRRDFISSEGGNAFMIFGLAFVPVMFMMGAATDYTRLTIARAALQQGTDAATLAVASKMTTDTTLTQALNQAQVVINSNPQLANATVTTGSISQDKQTFCATSTMTIQNAFMKMAQVANMTSSVTSCANLAGGVSPDATYEIALVLDNSGSMSSSAGGVSKMQALRSAATSFVNTMYSKSQNVKFSITPFAAAVVALDPTNSANRNLPWLDQQGQNSQHWVAFGGKAAANAQGFNNRFDIYTKLKTLKSSWDWKGCLEGPTYPNNVNDVAPNPSDPETLFMPYLAPDEPSNSNYNNNYLSDYSGTSCTQPSSNWAKLTNVCKYKAVTSAGSGGKGPNWYCSDPTTQTLMQLTTQQSAVTSKIAQLEEGGNTNLHEGFMWGWRTISPNLPFAGGRSYNAPNNRKIMVFMTDGANNWQSNTSTAVGSTYQALGYYSYNGTKNNRFPDGTNGDGNNYQTLLNASANKSSDYWGTSRDMLDDMTLEACTNAKAAGIEIFTIGFSTPTDPIDQQGLDLLKSCATNTDHYYKAENASDLNAAFSSIGIGLGKLRLSQ
ncbi:pilus assembly protein TadG-related protein [Methylocystis parvus]|uniref:TadE/TadG family type IV pilus assembly protein n=1 Tax=Methylocystis parvus TaxID=134 RepID=UPI003C70D381